MSTDKEAIDVQPTMGTRLPSAEARVGSPLSCCSCSKRSAWSGPSRRTGARWTRCA